MRTIRDNECNGCERVRAQGILFHRSTGLVTGAEGCAWCGYCVIVIVLTLVTGAFMTCLQVLPGSNGFVRNEIKF